MKNRTSLTGACRILKSTIGRMVIISVIGVSTGIGCAWSFWTDHSVRFNSMRNGRGFYRLPPLAIAFNPATKKEESVVENESYDELVENTGYDTEEEVSAEIRKVWERVMAATDSADLAGLQNASKEYLNHTTYEGTDEADQQGRRNAAVDILDALQELQEGASTKAVISYAKTRLELQEGIQLWAAGIEEVRTRAISGLNSHDRGLLEDNWAYLAAAILYRSGSKEKALAAFQSHDREFPRSEKNEAVLYMIAKLIMERGDSLTADCTAEACDVPEWQESIDAFRKLLKRYPNGQYSLDARGWIAHLYQSESRDAESLAEYYRLLGQTQNAQWRLEAKRSLQILGHDQEDTVLDKVEALIADEPDAALAYAYHRIYNHAVDLSYAEYNQWCCYGDDKWSQKNEERKRVSDEKQKGLNELQRIVKFTTAMVRRFGASRVSGDFLLRLSQANLELENYLEAHVNAEKAIKRGLSGNSLAEALWIKGSSEHQQKKLDSARVTFSRLIAEFPAHKLTEGARRLIAITAEDQDDLESALDQYIELQYKYDVAYFVDVLMPTDRLAKYVASRSKNAKHNELLYALGIRYMRDRRWDEARKTMRAVATKADTRDEEDYDYWPTRSPKAPDWDSEGEMFIRDSWVLSDLKTIDALEGLEQRVEQAGSDEAKAEAIYQLASYYYEGGSLLFYNSAAWDGSRYSLLSEFDGSANMRLPNESLLIFEYSQSHDNLARAIPIYMEIVDRFPDTKVAKDALYSTAVAHERLSNSNPYWRSIYEKDLFAGPRFVDYKTVQRTYPNYQLPRGTYGWKPSTRTVNDGPGWAPKPKPLPKLTTEQRVVRKVEKWADKYGATVWEKVVAVKDGVKDAAVYVSGAIAGYLQNYYYLVYTGFLGAIFWANRKEIYDGPVTKGSLLVHRGLTFLGRHVRGWWAAVAVPSVIRARTPGSGADERTAPAEAADIPPL